MKILLKHNTTTGVKIIKYDLNLCWFGSYLKRQSTCKNAPHFGLSWIIIFVIKVIILKNISF